MTRVEAGAARVEVRVAPGGGALTVTGAGVELFRYVHEPRDPTVESPRPYLHPVRTLDGDVVTVYRPHDHVVMAAGAWDRARIARVVDELVLPTNRLPAGPGPGGRAW